MPVTPALALRVSLPDNQSTTINRVAFIYIVELFHIQYTFVRIYIVELFHIQYTLLAEK